MTTETEVRELVLAFLQENAGDEFRLREVASGINRDMDESTLPQILAAEIESGEVVQRKAGRGVFLSAPATPPEFNAALWADGDLVLFGVELNPDGTSLTLKPNQVQLLCRLLHGQGPEA